MHETQRARSIGAKARFTGHSFDLKLALFTGLWRPATLLARFAIPPLVGREFIIPGRHPGPSRPSSTEHRRR